jgi:acetyl-CoA carboxylase carboxyl transferase subunit alpha
LGIGVGDRVMMMEYTWYSVISPESCSSILWRTWDKKELAADALKLSATDMKGNGLVDGIIPEPLGGAHHNPEEAFANVKASILAELQTLKAMSPEQLVNARIEKFSAMGVVQELPA